MRVVVCMKQVPDTNEVRINQETGTLIRDGVPSIMNPDDKNALEEALRMKDEWGAEVIALSMGPPQAEEILRESLSMGVDRAILLSDRKFGGSDTWATGSILAAAVEKIGDVDVVFCGRQAIDGDTAQVGPEMAEFLDIPQITYVKGLEREGEELLVRRFTEYGDYVYQVKTPVLLTAIKDLNVPRYPTILGILKHYDPEVKEIETWGFEDVAVDESRVGLAGSLTNVYRSFVPVRSKQSEMIEGNTAKEKTDTLVQRLSEIHLV
jgi:electron transfer flavoprotein alpha/beta subunit